MSVNGRFATTRWSLIRAAHGGDEPAAKAALADLCASYWFPIYSFVRRRGADDDRARDLTQEFFTRLLERDGLSNADPERGRFRSYLLAACQNFLANQHDHDSAQKRGGGIAPLSLDFSTADSKYGTEPAAGRTPEQEFDRRWALALLDQALATLRTEYEAGGKLALFERLKGGLTGEGETHAAMGEELGMSEGAVKVAAFRLRGRYRDCLRAAIAATVDSEDQIDDEIHALFAALGE